MVRGQHHAEVTVEDSSAADNDAPSSWPFKASYGAQNGCFPTPAWAQERIELAFFYRESHITNCVYSPLFTFIYEIQMLYFQHPLLRTPSLVAVSLIEIVKSLYVVTKDVLLGLLGNLIRGKEVLKFFDYLVVGFMRKV